MGIATSTIFYPKEEAQWDSTRQRRMNTKRHKYYCGIDLHARSMYICILGHGEKSLGRQAQSGIATWAAGERVSTARN